MPPSPGGNESNRGGNAPIEQGTACAYPTETQNRAKAKKAEKEKNLTAEQVRTSRNKKPQQQEDRHDDCGSDIEPILEKVERARCAFSEPDTYSFWFDTHCHERKHCEANHNQLRDPEIALIYLGLTQMTLLSF